MFSENYSVCLNDDGSPRQIARNGPVVTCKAIGYDSGRVVAMQLIPLVSIDEVDRVRLEESARAAQRMNDTNLARVFDVGIKDDHFVFVTEYLEGEPADAWVRAHGPMPADAVLRIGFQAMKVLAEATAHRLTHRSIQPANLMILPGVAADGGWPRVKLLNFGLAGLQVHSDGDETHELVPSMPPEFSSPEQLENKPLDFRSDIFSLGAAMWFLLTGAAPLSSAPTEAGRRLSAPQVPRFVRNLVSRMLRTNPEERPQDAAAFAEKIHACLQKAERQTAFTRSFGPAPITTLPRPEKRRVAPALALAASIVVLAALSAFFVPRLRSQRQSKPLGVIIGVPETTDTSPASISSASPLPVNQSTNIASLASPASIEQPDSVAQQSTSAPAPPVNSVGGASFASPGADKSSASPQLAANNRMAEPPAPAENPPEDNPASVEAPAPTTEKDEMPPSDLPDRTATAAKDSVATTSSGNEPPNSTEHIAAAKRDDSSAPKTKPRRKRLAKSSARPLPPLRVRSEPARFVGTTPGGRWLLRLPSGETVVTPPVPDVEDAPIVSPRRVRRVLRPMPLEDEPAVIVLPPDL